MDFETRLTIAEEMVARDGLTLQIAEFVLEDDEWLGFSDLSDILRSSSVSDQTAEVFEHAVRGKGLFVDINLVNGPVEFGPSQKFATTDEYLAHLLFRTVIEADYCDGAVKACARLLKDPDVYLGKLMSSWLAEHLDGRLERPPPPKGPDAHKYGVRNSVISFAVQALVSLGYPVFRNETGEPNTACDHVASALGRVSKINLTPDAVSRIYRAEIERQTRE